MSKPHRRGGKRGFKSLGKQDIWRGYNRQGRKCHQVVTFHGKHWGIQHLPCKRAPELLECSSVPFLSKPGLTVAEAVTELGSIMETDMIAPQTEKVYIFAQLLETKRTQLLQ